MSIAIQRRRPFVRCPRARQWVLVLVTATTAVALVASSASAKGSANLSVATTASVSGTTVSGVITITNGGSKAETVTAIRDSLEVRYPSGSTPPALPVGSASGWYTVATLSLPGSRSVAAKQTIRIDYSIATCGTGVAVFSGAKDMRNAAVVTASSIASGASANFPLPGRCPLCGNGVVEAGEQCDSGYGGAACCTTACQFRPNGTACNDGNACTRTDVCQAGLCSGGSLVTCQAADACRVAGTCNPATGACSNPVAANGTPCDDGSACTRSDACQAGLCRGSDPVACATSGPCQIATCDVATGTCSSHSQADGSECMDGDACTVGDRCVAGACASGPPRDCDDHLTCTEDACAAATGCAHGAARCDACDAAECGACGDACDAAQGACADGCWTTFMGCLSGCTSTYCAPFCQVDLSRCLAACPTSDACRAACDAGNACAPGCAEPQ